jgi:hypothetical protein
MAENVPQIVGSLWRKLKDDLVQFLDAEQVEKECVVAGGDEFRLSIE